MCKQMAVLLETFRHEIAACGRHYPKLYRSTFPNATLKRSWPWRRMSGRIRPGHRSSFQVACEDFSSMPSICRNRSNLETPSLWLHHQAIVKFHQHLFQQVLGVIASSLFAAIPTTATVIIEMTWRTYFGLICRPRAQSAWSKCCGTMRAKARPIAQSKICWSSWHLLSLTPIKIWTLECSILSMCTGYLSSASSVWVCIRRNESFLSFNQR